MDRTNRIRKAFESGETALGAAVSTYSPAVIETYGELGLDFAWLDFEHAGVSPSDGHTFEALGRAAEAGGVDPLVRIPSPDPHLIRKVLDAGIRTVLIPRVESAAEVREAVAASKFTYDGEPGGRGVGLNRSSGWGADFGDYAKREDESVLIGVMIENRTAIENLSEILAVPDLGFVFVGPADLSVSLGAPLETDSPAVRDRIERIRTAALDADVPLGGIADDARDGREMIEDGYELLRIGSELGAARTVLGDRLAALR